MWTHMCKQQIMKSFPSQICSLKQSSRRWPSGIFHQAWTCPLSRADPLISETSCASSTLYCPLKHQDFYRLFSFLRSIPHCHFALFTPLITPPKFQSLELIVCIGTGILWAFGIPKKKKKKGCGTFWFMWVLCRRNSESLEKQMQCLLTLERIESDGLLQLSSLENIAGATGAKIMSWWDWSKFLQRRVGFKISPTHTHPLHLEYRHSLFHAPNRSSGCFHTLSESLIPQPSSFGGGAPNHRFAVT